MSIQVEVCGALPDCLPNNSRSRALFLGLAVHSYFWRQTYADLSLFFMFETHLRIGKPLPRSVVCFACMTALLIRFGASSRAMRGSKRFLKWKRSRCGCHARFTCQRRYQSRSSEHAQAAVRMAGYARREGVGCWMGVRGGADLPPGRPAHGSDRASGGGAAVFWWAGRVIESPGQRCGPSRNQRSEVFRLGGNQPLPPYFGRQAQ